MAKKRKAKKGKIKRKRTAKKKDPKKRLSRKPGLRVVATSEKEEAEIPRARTPHGVHSCKVGHERACLPRP